MGDILGILKLEPLKGERTQWTVIAGLVLNLLVQFHILNLTPENLDVVNKFLILVGTYFFADKFSGKKVNS